MLSYLISKNSKNFLSPLLWKKIPKIATLLWHWAKVLSNFVFINILPAKKSFSNNLSMKKLFNFSSLCAKTFCTVISHLLFNCLDVTNLGDNVKFLENFVYFWFFSFMRKNLSCWDFLSAFYTSTRTSSAKTFDEFQKKVIILWKLMEKNFGWSSEIFNLHVQWKTVKH